MEDRPRSVGSVGMNRDANDDDSLDDDNVPSPSASSSVLPEAEVPSFDALKGELEQLRAQMREMRSTRSSALSQFALFALWIGGLAFIVQFYLTHM